MEVLTGQFKNKIYGSSNGNYHVYRFQPNNRKECTAILFGAITPDLVGVFTISGKWRIDSHHGPQFVISHSKRYKTNIERGNDYLKHIKGMLVA